MLAIFIAATLGVTPLAESFKQAGYVEISDRDHGRETFDALYASFDELIAFFQENPGWANKLYVAKERFIRSKDRNEYSTEFFGLYDESETRSQVAFYYSTHFHDFICTHYPELCGIPEISRFFEACRQIQNPYGSLFDEASAEVGLSENLSILFKVVKYLSSYIASRPHYDGSAFSLFLDSTDNQSLLLSPYKSSFTIEDFSSPPREGILLIPGTLLIEFSIFPTPHIVTQSGKIRYATIAFAMRPNLIPRKFEFASLPRF